VESVSTAFISQSLKDHDPWINESSASGHIFNQSSSFLLISSPKIPQYDVVANGSKVTYQGTRLSRAIFE